MYAFRLDSFKLRETFFPENFSMARILSNGLGTATLEGGVQSSEDFHGFYGDIFKIFRPDGEYTPYTLNPRGMSAHQQGPIHGDSKKNIILPSNTHIDQLQASYGGLKNSFINGLRGRSQVRKFDDENRGKVLKIK